MTAPKFTIPPEFRSELHYVDVLDHRSDQEILDSLSKHIPITSEKNVWAYWHAGVHSMPAWCRRNVLNWIRLNGPSWTIRVLDSVPSSENNALRWIDDSLLPEAFVKGTMDGPYVGPHSADFLKSAAVYKYGGVWIDVGCILFRKLDDICWKQLEDPECPFTVSVPLMARDDTMIANHFVAGRKEDPFIKHWHDLFVHFWAGRNNHGGILQDPLVQFYLESAATAVAKAEESSFKWEFIVSSHTIVEYIAQCLAWIRVASLEEPNGGFNGSDYWQNKVLAFSSLTEDWAAEETIGFVGQDLYDALATRTDADPKSEQYKKAYKTIWRLLTKSSMQKVTHGKNLTKTPALGILWDTKGNEGKDIEPGTFAELLRYGSLHFEQECRTE